MRIPARSFATLLLGVGVATCSDTPIATVKTGASPEHPGFARVGSFEPRFTKAAAAINAQLAARGASFDNVHVILRGSPDTTKIIAEKFQAFGAGQDSIVVDFDSVQVQNDGQKFDAGLRYRAGNVELFSGHVVVPSYKPGTPPPATPHVDIDYVGPGSDARRIAIVPKTLTMPATGVTTFSPSAFTATNTPVSAPPLTWSVSDASLASITQDGTLTGLGRRGTVTVTATYTFTGGTASDQASVTFTLPPSLITTVGGNGQTGKVGTTLANPGVVQVTAADGGPVSGVNVIFSPPTGGSVGTASATTDANGRAQTTLTLGGTAGPQSFAATAGALATAINETATAGDPSAITIVSGNNQTAAVSKPLPAGLSVKVTDSFGNAVSGTTVSWARTAGTGALGSATSVTGADGIAANTYTTGTTAGPEGVSASITGKSASFSFTTTAGEASQIAIVSGNGQTGRVAQALANPFVVKVTDVGNNPVANATVTWSATNGTIATTSTTNADGQASATLTAGNTLGGASAVAKLANNQSVTFGATIQAGFVSQVVFSTQPTDGTTNVVLPAVAVALRDVGGNATVAVNSVTIALGNNPSGATLTGTLTRNAVNGTATFDDLKLDKLGTGYTLIAKSGSLTPVTSTAFNVGVGAAANIAIVAGDNQSATVSTAVATAPSVKVTDASNNVLSGVTVTFAPPSGSGTATPASVTTDASGIATVTSWTLGSTAGAQTLVASAGSAGSVTFHATATAGTAGSIAIVAGDNQSATVGTAITTAPSVKVTDASNNPVASVVVTFAPPSGSGTVTPASVTTNASGIATVTSWTLGSTAGAQTLVASANGAGSVTFHATATAGAAGHVSIVAGDNQTATVNTTVTTAPSVKVTDASNNPVAGVVVTFAPPSGSGAVTPGSVTTDASGIATVTSWQLGTTAGAQTLVASASGAGSATVHAIANAGAASKLAITTPPSGAVSGFVLTQQPVLQVQDQFGNAVAATVNIVTTATPSATIAGGSVASNSTTGAIAFSSLKITTTAASVTLTFAVDVTSPITSVTSSSISVSQAPASQLILNPTTTSYTITTGQVLSPSPTVLTADANGTAVGATPVHFVITTNSGATTLFDQNVTSNGSGIIDAGSLVPSSATNTVGVYTITGSLVSTPSVSKTVTLTVNPGAADHIVFSGAAAVGTAGSGTTTFATGKTVTVQDALNNAVGSGVTVFWSLGSPCATGISLASGTSLTNSSGVATAPTLTVPNGVAASCQVNATIDDNSIIRAPLQRRVAPRRAAGASLRPIGGGTESMDLVREFTFYAIMKPSGSIAWTANSSQDFNTAANWDGGVAATSSSAVFMPNAVPGATLSADAAVGSVKMETGSNVSIGLNTTRTLTVSGDVTTNTGGINNGTLKIEGTGATNIVGTLPTTIIGNATACGSSSYTLTGATTAGPVTVNCTLNVGANSLSTANSGGGLTVGGSAGKIVMANSAGFIDIGGAATFGGLSETGSLTDGTAKFRGGLTVSANGSIFDTYAPTSNHLTQFLGTSTQHVAVCASCATASAFNNIEFVSSSNVTFDNNATFAGTFTVRSATVKGGTGVQLSASGAVTSESGSRLDGIGEMLLTGTNFPSFNSGSSLSSPAKTTVQHDISLSAGAYIGGKLDVQKVLTIGANQLLVSGDFSTSTSTGRISMTNASGLVDVSGASKFGGADEGGSLTAGTFEARGDFSQVNNGGIHDTYNPSGAHKTSLWGGSAQNISFEDPVNSFFYDAEVRNSGITATFTTPVLVKNNFVVVRAGGSGSPVAKFSDTLKVVGNLTAGNGTALNFTSGATRRRIIVGGTVTDSSSADLGGVDTLLITGSTFPVYLNTTAGKAPDLTRLTGTVSMTADRTIGGGLEVGTNLTLAGKTLTVLDSVNVTGNLKFLAASSGGTLKVGRKFKIAGSGTVTGETGTLELAGDFSEEGTTATAFQPSTTAPFITKLTGTSAQSISFDHPRTDQSYFAELSVQNSNSAVATFSRNGVVKGKMRIGGTARLATGSALKITAMDSVISDNGSIMSGVVELVDSASTFPAFSGTSPAKTTIVHSGGNVLLHSGATLTGALSVQSPLVVNGNILTVGDLTVEGTAGYLIVENPHDSVVVNGNAEFKGANTDDFATTDGAYDFKGNFKATTTKSFYVSSATNNTVRFTGTSAQTIDMSGTDNTFANVAIGRRNDGVPTAATFVSSHSNVTFTTDAIVKGLMDLHSDATATINTGYTLTLSNSDPALNFHDGSKMYVNGTVLPVRPNCRYSSGGTRGSPEINGTGIFDGVTVSQGSANGVSTSILNSCTDALSTLP